ncbi:MAG: hypothetical protein ABW170_04360 [Candidatus Thiodiazotropha sp. L084R]
MEIEIHWTFAENEDDEILNFHRVLYAYTDGAGKNIFYIGKADGCSVKQRLRGSHKKDVFEYLEKKVGLSEYGLAVGEFHLPEGRRLSPELISDAESLLIYILKPRANIQSVESRISRPGMELICYGDWPYHENHFVDD